MKLLTRKEVAEWLGVCVRTCERYGIYEKIPCIVLGKRTRYDQRDVENYINQLRSTSVKQLAQTAPKSKTQKTNSLPTVSIIPTENEANRICQNLLREFK